MDKDIIIQCIKDMDMTSMSTKQLYHVIQLITRKQESD